MRKERVLTGYTERSDQELAVIGGRILKAMKDPLNKTNFPDPTPDMETFEVVVNDYTDKLLVASHRGSGVQKGEKNEGKAALVSALLELGQYVNRKANGRLPLLLASGFDLAGTPTATLAPLTTAWVLLRDGRYSGQIKIDFAKVKNAGRYWIEIGQMNAQGDIDWNERLSTTRIRGNLVFDKVPGVRYYVRVQTSNNKGESDWSVPVSIIAR